MINFLILTLLLACACKEEDKKKIESLVSGNTSTPKSSSTSKSTDDFTEQFMELIDDHRVSIGLLPLILSDELNAIVTQHSSDMASEAVEFGHLGFSERCAAGRIAIGGGNLCAENVAMGQKTPEAAFNAWMNSEGHRENIESSRVTHTGFGYKQSSSGKYYWTQIFIEKR